MSTASGAVKPYEAEGFYFEFSPNGSPYVGTLRTTDEAESGPYEAEVNLQKAGSRERYAKKAGRALRHGRHRPGARPQRGVHATL